MTKRSGARIQRQPAGGIDAVEIARAFQRHAAGLANGGTTCENPPGIREGSTGKLYLAYLRDLDGNKLCAMHRMAS